MKLLLGLSMMLVMGTLHGARKKTGTELVNKIEDIKELKKLLKTHTNVLIAYCKSGKDINKISSLFSTVADEVRGVGTLAVVDCSEAKKLCKKYKVYPSSVTLNHYSKGEFTKEYDRKLVAKSMVSFLRDPTGDIPWEEEEGAQNVKHIKGIQDFMKVISKKKALVMFYAPWCGHCKRLKPDYSKAATTLRGNAVLAGLDAEKPDNLQLRMQFNVTGYPTLIYFESGEMKFNYGGEQNYDGIIEWMKKPSAPKPPEPAKSWADETEDVDFLTAENFDGYLTDNPSTLIMFYAPWCGHCKRMKPDYEKAAKFVNDEKLGKLAAVDATAQPSLRDKFSVQGYPTVKYFKDGKLEFDVNARTEEAIVKFMKNPEKPPSPPEAESAWADQESSVAHLTAETFGRQLKQKKHALIMFYAPWCGHCKKAKPHFTDAAELYKDVPKVMYGAVDCTVHTGLCSEFGVNGYPTIKYFSYGKNPQDYNMGREKADFLQYMKSVSSLSPAEEKSTDDEVTEEPVGSDHEQPATDTEEKPMASDKEKVEL